MVFPSVHTNRFNRFKVGYFTQRGQKKKKEFKREEMETLIQYSRRSMQILPQLITPEI